MKKTLIFLFLIIALHYASAYKYFSAFVIKINDGDTITVLSENNNKLKIRLYGIDCPEIDQAFGNKAKIFTEKLVQHQKVHIKKITIDQYKRIVALVYIDDICLNEIILAYGYAWVYRKYCKKPYIDKWMKYENHARKNSLGLWSEKDFIPPWNYRKNPQVNLLKLLPKNIEKRNIVIISVILLTAVILFIFLKILKRK